MRGSHHHGIQHGMTATFAAGVHIVVAVVSANAQAPFGPPAIPHHSLDHGITVLEFDRTAFDRAPQVQIDPRPVAVFGGVSTNPDFDLTHTSGTLLDDGSVAAFDFRENHILVFGPDGTPRRVIGRIGAGPGEFRQGSMVPLGGDTLLVFDRANARLSWVLPDRGVIRMESTAERVPSIVWRPVGELGGGIVVLTSAGSYGIVTSLDHPLTTMAKIVVLQPHQTGTTIDSVSDYTLVPTPVPGYAAPRALTREFDPHAQLAIWNNLIATGTGDSYTVNLEDIRGRVVERLVVSTPRRPVTAAIRDADLNARLAHARPAAVPSVRATRYADSLPAYTWLDVSADDVLWIGDASAPGDTTWTATAFRADGAIIARVNADHAGSPWAFGSNCVLLRYTDADGIVHFELHRLIPAKSR